MIIYQVKVQKLFIQGGKIENVKSSVVCFSSNDAAKEYALNLAKKEKTMPCEQKGKDTLRRRTSYTWSYDHDEKFKVHTIEVLRSELKLEDEIINEVHFNANPCL